jgi:NMD protein affecting ribosome stability and mRNA decay
MPLNPNRACVNCGDPVQGSGDLCADCTPSMTAPAGVAVCPYCNNAAPWEQMRRYRQAHENGRVEVLYYCPSCRGVLEAACWMER